MSSQHRDHAFSLLALGFRPFYLLAMLCGAIAVPLWMVQLFTTWSGSHYLHGADWHTHEMIFGFAVAVISGLLLTAVRNWTQLPTPTGGALALLALLWVAGRVTLFTGPTLLAVLFDLLFIPTLAVAIGLPLFRSRNRSRFLLLILVGLFCANLFFHANAMGLTLANLNRQVSSSALIIIAVLISIIGGRIIPLFIANARPQAVVTQHSMLDSLATGILLGILCVDIFVSDLAPGCIAVLYGFAAAIHLWRLSLWAPTHTRSESLLWILPVSYSWIPIWLALEAGTALGWVIPGLAIHALAIGGMSSLMVGMMTRSALGHTGRPLCATRYETVAFCLLQLAAVSRIAPTLVDPSGYSLSLYVSAVCWTGAFLTLLLRYGPILMQPRIDGKPG